MKIPFYNVTFYILILPSYEKIIENKILYRAYFENIIIMVFTGLGNEMIGGLDIIINTDLAFMNRKAFLKHIFASALIIVPFKYFI